KRLLRVARPRQLPPRRGGRERRRVARRARRSLDGPADAKRAPVRLQHAAASAARRRLRDRRAPARARRAGRSRIPLEPGLLPARLPGGLADFPALRGPVLRSAAEDRASRRRIFLIGGSPVGAALVLSSRRSR